MEGPVIIGYRRIGIAIKLHKGIYVVPDVFVIGVKDVRSVGVDIDSFYILTVRVASNVISTVNDQAFFSSFCGFMCPDISKEACTNY